MHRRKKKGKKGNREVEEVIQAELVAMEIRTLVFILVLCILYMIGGAGLFIAIESEAEIQRQTLILHELNAFLENSCTSRADLLAFLDFIHKDMGIVRYVMRANNTANIMWDFAGALSFVESLITTIGYGHIVPRTTLGRCTCVLYALLGVPLMMACLSAVGEKLCQISNRWSNCRVGGFCTATTQRRIHVSLQCIVCIVIVFVLPTAINMYLESWTMLESLYFVFITLMTVGFGDFVGGKYLENPDFETSAITRFLRCINLMWTLIGLAYISMGINTIMQLYLDGTKRTEQISDRSIRRYLKRLRRVWGRSRAVSISVTSASEKEGTKCSSQAEDDMAITDSTSIYQVTTRHR